jgi:uncharacterized protein
MASRTVLGDGHLSETATVDRDVFVTMRDGVRIACDVYRPREPGSYPVLFAASPYIKDSVFLPSTGMYRYRETGWIGRWVDRGYVYVLCDVRGTGKSEGVYNVLGPIEQHDCCEMIEWAGTQLWSNGNVGMIGESYYGMIQWQVAQHNPKHLACIAPYDGGADIYRHRLYKGGILFQGFANHWWNNSVLYRHFLDYPDRPKRDDLLEYNYAREIALRPTFDDEFWTSRRVNLSKIECPVFSIGIWESLGVHLLGNLQGFMQASGPKKLMVNSGDPQKLFLDDVVEQELIKWYDRWLKGIENGVMNEVPVRIFVRPSDGFRHEQEWPPASAVPRNLYLSGAGSGAVESLNDGSLSWDDPTVPEASTSYDSPDPQWSIPGPGSSVMGRGGFPHTTRRIITFTSPPMEEDLEITGPVVLNLWASSTATDAQFIANIMDMAPASADQVAAYTTLDVAQPARKVTMGWLKASHRTLDEGRSTPLSPYHTHVDPQPMEPGAVYPLQIEIWPTSWVFKAEHRIRLDIMSFDGQHHLGHLRGRDTFHHDAHRPSHLVLPVIPR